MFYNELKWHLWTTDVSIKSLWTTDVSIKIPCVMKTMHFVPNLYYQKSSVPPQHTLFVERRIEIFIGFRACASTTGQWFEDARDLIQTGSSVLDLEKTLTQSWDKVLGDLEIWKGGYFMEEWKTEQKWIHLTSTLLSCELRIIKEIFLPSLTVFHRGIMKFTAWNNGKKHA